MRVLVVLLSASFAGTERHAVELANGLHHYRETALLLRDRPADPRRHAEYAVLRAAIAPEVTVYRASRAAPWFGLWRALWHFRPDVIHAHHERSARIATRAARFIPGIGTPVIATLHMRYRARDYRRCAGLICLTEAQAAEIPPDYPGLRAVIGNWVLPHPRPDDATLRNLRAELGLSPGDHVVGTVGRLAPVKGMAGLIQAFANAALPCGKLLIVGEGVERADLEALADRLGAPVIFAGFRPDVRDLYFLFDLFVLNSAEEPYGLATLEALASGVAVIATDTAGSRAISREAPIRLVPVGDPDALAAALADAHPSPATPHLAGGFARADRLRAIERMYDAVSIAGAP